MENWEEHFGEGFAKPIKFLRRLGQLGLRLLNPYYPADTLGGEPTAQEKLHQFFEEARAEEAATTFDMGDDLFMRHYSSKQNEFWLRRTLEDDEH